MILKVIHRLHAFSNTIRRTVVQHFTRFQLTVCSHGFSALAELLVYLWHTFLKRNAVKSPSTYPERSCSCVADPSSPFLIIFSNSCTGSRYSSALNRKLALARISSFSLLLHVIPARSYHSPAFSIHSIIHISYSSQSSVDSTPLQSQHHKPLLPVCRASPVKQASSYYSSCSLSVRSFIITQLFSIVML